MNFILCGEPCRHQKDGYCELDSLTHAGFSTACSKCKYFEEI